MTSTAKTYKSGNSVSIRLPKDIAYPAGLELTATRTGDVIVLAPKRRRTPSDTVASLRSIGFPDTPDLERPAFDYPDRPGLFD
jgi:antitoxin VapB